MTQTRAAAVERTMKVYEVMLRAMSKQISWWQAAEILGVSTRTIRRWKAGYEKWGYSGLADHRKGKPAVNRVAMETAERVLQLYREQYWDFNVRHFHEKLREEHHIQLSYSWLKNALQGAGLVANNRRRKPHRKRRARRPLTGMMLHIDGSHHQWFCDDRWYDLLVILDDATSEIYYAQLVEDESTRTVMTALRHVVEAKGLFCSLYSDRAGHFFHTPKTGEPVDYRKLTQVGRAMKELGIDMIPAYSPQARGRSERSFRTWQGRLPQELRLRAIGTLDGANTFLQRIYVREFNRRFTVPAAQPGTAFIATERTDLDRVFSIHHERTVNADNTVRWSNVSLQIQEQSGRATLSGCRVIVFEHLDGSLSIGYGPHTVGSFTPDGRAILAGNSETRGKKKSAQKEVGADFFVKAVTSAAR